MTRPEGIIARVRLLFGRRSAEVRMEEEIGFHLDMETERLVREGLERSEARRRARVSFGGTDKVREELREGRGLAWLSGLGLDVKLGFRMLVKYPGLTLVGGLAMAFAICIGAVSFEILKQIFDPTLPLPDGDRIVGVSIRDVAESRAESRVQYEFVSWRGRLRSIDDLSAFRTTERNVSAHAGLAEPLQIAEISASAFRVTRVAPLLGRPLVEADEEPGGESVVVIGHDVWQRHFGGAADVIGRTIGLGRERATVVGVMPEGYSFPVAHSVWMPLRLNEASVQPRTGRAVSIFGRLAPGATYAGAQAEVNALGAANAAAHPATHEHLRPQVMPYAAAILNMSLNVPGEVDLRSLAGLLRTTLNLPLVLFLILVCGNIALLVFARAATRESEIIVRSALGGQRRRIVAQMFVETLVLGVVAAGLGLAVATFALDWALAFATSEMRQGARMPFWFGTGVSLETMLYALLLTVAGAAIAGIVPALKVTRGIGTQLRQASAGGGGFRFGGVWTAVIVSQIAVTVPIPVIVWALHAETRGVRAADPGVAAQQYLIAELQLDRESATPIVRDTSRAALLDYFGATLRELEQRLEADAAVTGVTFADRLPRMYHPYRLVEVDEGTAAPLDPRWPAYRISTAFVAPDFFDVMNVPVLAGRGFNSSDALATTTPVIVNESFVKRVLGGGQAVGRHVRYTMWSEMGEVTGNEPWFEIIGVVPDMGMSYGENDPKIAGFYVPVAPGAASSVQVAVHVNATPATFETQLRAAAAAVDPGLRVDGVMPLDRVVDADVRFYRIWFWLVVTLNAIALLLALAGIYAVTSFTVSQRTREIGVRVALGADSRRIVLAIFRKPLAQVGMGVGAGGVVLATLLFGLSDTAVPASAALVLLLYLAVMMLVCMVAWIVPTRRALSVEPTEALRWD